MASKRGSRSCGYRSAGGGSVSGLSEPVKKSKKNKVGRKGVGQRNRGTMLGFQATM